MTLEYLCCCQNFVEAAEIVEILTDKGNNVERSAHFMSNDCHFEYGNFL